MSRGLSRLLWIICGIVALGFHYTDAAEAPAPASEPAKMTDAELAKVGKTGFTRDWTVDELFRKVNIALNSGGRNYQRGEKVWDVVGCGLCHHFGGGTGGIGPNLTGLGNRYGAQEILEAIIEPSKQISDLFGAVVVTTSDNKRYTGRPVGTTDTAYQIIAAPSIDPGTGTMSWIGPVISIPNDKIVDISPSEVSPMPAGLMNSLTEDEIIDFMAYLMSAGNPDDKFFKPKLPAAPAPAPAAAKK